MWGMSDFILAKFLLGEDFRYDRKINADLVS